VNQFSLLVTCEHAGNHVPDKFVHLFTKADEVLNSHRGWDPGALPLAVALGEYWEVQPILYFLTRLLIEPNRSRNHPELFSDFSKVLTSDQQQGVINEFYIPYRDGVEKLIQQMQAPVLHLSIHTFTPVFEGVVRDVDMGLLFDPDRAHEKLFCEEWKIQLLQVFPDWKVEFNEPYKGIDDGFTTYLRKRFSNDHYLGIELEWNQKWATQQDASKWYEGIKQSLAFITRLQG
jgi:predicted N-formylglutamate amidohydrolase